MPSCAGKTAEFRSRLADGESLDDLLPEAFAAVREATKRTIGLRHYDVQLIGGMALHQGKIAEMRTGEGKTLVATLPMYLNALTGNGVHLITVNDYLARRDARWMAPIYQLLGLSVGVLQMAARTENGKKAFLVDLEKNSPHEDQHQLRMVPRAEAYAADITYGTNSEFGFDYLRDNMTMRLDDRVQRGHYFAIVDEVDNVLIDEARTPLIISGPAQDETEWYVRMAQVVRQLRPEDYEINEKRPHRHPDRDRRERTSKSCSACRCATPTARRMSPPSRRACWATWNRRCAPSSSSSRNKDYLVQAGKVVIVDEFTGRLMPGRRWSDGLHQAVEAKEGVRVQAENVTYATITIQNYFRMYEKLAGMTGTALTEAEEFDKIYKLDVLAIPTNLEYQAVRAGIAAGSRWKARTSRATNTSYYARRDDPQKHAGLLEAQGLPGCDLPHRGSQAPRHHHARSCATTSWAARCWSAPPRWSFPSASPTACAPSRCAAWRRCMLLRRSLVAKNNREEDGRQVPELQFLNGTARPAATSPTCARWRASWTSPSTPKTPPTWTACSPKSWNCPPSSAPACRPPCRAASRTRC